MDFYINKAKPLSLVLLRKVDLVSDLRVVENGAFPNFIFLSKDSEMAKMRKSTLSGMINQQTDPLIMVTQFCNIARRFYSAEDVEQFQEDFKIDLQPAEHDVIIRQYTKDTFFHRLLNNILRIGKDPLELYYAQHFVKLLHLAIKARYRKDILKPDRRSFVCFSGGVMNQCELKMLK